MHHSPKHTDIAIVGVSALFPGAKTSSGFWKNILEGADLIREIPESHWRIDDYFNADPTAVDKTYCKRGAFLDEMGFDCLQHSLSPKQLEATDTLQLLALIVAEEVLKDASQGQFSNIDKERCSVILGATSVTELVLNLNSRLQQPIWLNALRKHGIEEQQAQAICESISNHYVPWSESSFPGLLGNVVAGRIANRFDLGGTNCVVDAACASTQSALAMSLNELYLGQADLCITGGVDCLNDILMYMCFSKTPALSATGDCRPFSDNADGTIIGEGLGMIALRRLEDAERDGDPIYALIKGLGSSSDGSGTAIYAPKANGQAKALSRAYNNAGYSPETVGLVEAHGTGTKAGDAAEFEGLKQVFTTDNGKLMQYCALGSVKSQIGHTKAAAGAASLFKTIMALHHKVLPPTIKINQPNPKLNIETSAFYLNTKARPWVRSPGTPRRASVSSFGFGGSNFHVTLEEYTKKDAAALKSRETPSEMCLVAEASKDSLLKQLERLTRDSSSENFQFICRDSQLNIDSSHAYKLAIIAKDSTQLQELSIQAASAIAASDLPSQFTQHWVYAAKPTPGKIGFLFPGQGSQYLHMGSDLAMNFDCVRQIYDQSLDHPLDAVKTVSTTVFPIPVFNQDLQQAQTDALVDTRNSQVAIGSLSAGMTALLKQLGVTADCFAGHSFGELSALHAAGVYDTNQLLALAATRGELMHLAAKYPGTMTAVSYSATALASLLSEWKIDITIANHNSPKQVVLSGSIDAIEAVEEKLTQQSIAFARLKVASAFHTKIVAPACTPFEEYLSQLSFASPSAPVYSNTNAQAYPDSPQSFAKQLAEQIALPVRFADQIEAMYTSGVRTFIEVGPGQILSRLTQDCLGDRPHQTISLDSKSGHGMDDLYIALSKLFVQGIKIDFSALWSGIKPIEDPKLKPEAKLSFDISGVNYGKPEHPRYAAVKPSSSQEQAPKILIDHPLNHSTPLPMDSVSMSTTPPNSPPSDAAPDAWIQAFQDLQKNTAQAHTQFLKVAERSLIGLEKLHTNQAPYDQVFENQSTTSNIPNEVMAQIPQPLPATIPDAIIAPQMEVSTVPASEAKSNDTPNESINISDTLITIVAEKTGYPAEMVQLDMQLEDDLGIDSIKRVEILSALKEQLTHLPSLDPSELGGLSSLQEIVDYFNQTIQPLSHTEPTIEPQQATHSNDATHSLLAVVADKTGYPVDMLELDMDLENDLGIDSIKRVEILSAMRALRKNMPESDPSEMAGLNSLGDVINYMQVGAPHLPPIEASNPSEPSTSIDAQLLSIIAEKTGYPESMLNMDMDLENDLGIDSIKRVEILSALKQRVPELEQMDPSMLNQLSTLQSISDFFNRDSDQQGSSTTSTPEPLTEKLNRFQMELTDVKPPGFALPLLYSETAYLLDDKKGIATALSDSMRNLGIDARVVSVCPIEAKLVISLNGLRPTESIDDALAINHETFKLARTLAPNYEQGNRVLVLVQDTGGDFAFDGSLGNRAWTGGIAALAKTAALEWPQSTVRCIDIDSSSNEASATAARLLNELLHGGCEPSIGLSKQMRRVTLQPSEHPINVQKSSMTEPAVIVATGGGRGVTAESVIALAQEMPCKFALLGRTDIDINVSHYHNLPSDTQLNQEIIKQASLSGETLNPIQLKKTARHIRSILEINDTLNRVRALGSEVTYYCCDISQRLSLTQCIAQVKTEFGPLTGIIHGAGVLADKRIGDLSDEQFSSVFSTKVQGLRLLLAATAKEKLDFLCLFSSIAAVSGNIGQAAYAMANEVLNKIASAMNQKRKHHCRVVSINWGPWEGGMVGPELAEHFKSNGVPLIPMDLGSRACVREILAKDSDTIEVVLSMGDLNLRQITQPAYEKIISIEVGRNSHPYLDSHRIQGAVVIPLVLVQEWFIRACRAAFPGPFVTRCQSMSVLKGVRLKNFDHKPETFTIKLINKKDSQFIQAELHDGNGRKRYTAHLEMENNLLVSDGIAPTPKLEAYPLDSKPLYGEQLFHGKDFAIIKSIEGISKGSASASLSAIRETNWNQEPWYTDPVLLDGGLQLARIWGFHVLGKPSLPTSLGETVIYKTGLNQSACQCILSGETIGNTGIRCDLWFVDDTGQLLAEIRELEMHITLADDTHKQQARGAA